MKIKLKVVSELYSRFLRMEIGVRSSALAFSTLLAIVPVLGMLLRYLQRAGITGRWIDSLKTFILSHLNAGNDAAVTELIDKLTQAVGSRAWGWVGLFIFLYATWNLITRFAGSLDYMLKVRSADDTPLTWTFIGLTIRRAFIMLTLPGILLASVAAQTWIRDESWMKTLFAIQTVGPLFAVPLAWSVDVIGLTFIYYFVPRRQVTYQSALVSAVVATLGLELSKFLVGAYNVRAVTTHELYGIFAAIPLTLLWIQICWIIILAGGLLLKPRRKRRGT